MFIAITVLKFLRNRLQWQILVRGSQMSYQQVRHVDLLENSSIRSCSLLEMASLAERPQ